MLSKFKTTVSQLQLDFAFSYLVATGMYLKVELN
jgi:hypothetical protein